MIIHTSYDIDLIRAYSIYNQTRMWQTHVFMQLDSHLRGTYACRNLNITLIVMVTIIIFFIIVMLDSTTSIIILVATIMPISMFSADDHSHGTSWIMAVMVSNRSTTSQRIWFPLLHISDEPPSHISHEPQPHIINWLKFRSLPYRISWGPPPNISHGALVYDIILSISMIGHHQHNQL